MRQSLKKICLYCNNQCETVVPWLVYCKKRNDVKFVGQTCLKWTEIKRNEIDKK